MIKAIASLSHGEVVKPRPDDYQLIVNFSNGDDKRTFLDNFKRVQEDVNELDNLSIVANDHGLQTTVDVNTIWT